MIRVLIADDHELAREGLKAVLEQQDHLALVGQAATPDEAVRLAGELKPDVILMDIRFGQGHSDGLAATREIVAADPAARVLMLTLHDTADYVRAALEAGALGYVLKDAAAAELVAAIGRVAQGQTSVAPDLLKSAMAAPGRSDAQGAAERLRRLTPREREVLDQMMRGLTNKEIARELDLAPGTVKVHVERLILKLEVGDRTEAAVLAAMAARG